MCGDNILRLYENQQSVSPLCHPLPSTATLCRSGAATRRVSRPHCSFDPAGRRCAERPLCSALEAAAAGSFRRCSITNPADLSSDKVHRRARAELWKPLNVPVNMYLEYVPHWREMRRRGERRRFRAWSWNWWRRECVSDTAGTELDGSSFGIPVGASDVVPVRVLCSQVLPSRAHFRNALIPFLFLFSRGGISCAKGVYSVRLSHCSFRCIVFALILDQHFCSSFFKDPTKG